MKKRTLNSLSADSNEVNYIPFIFCAALLLLQFSLGRGFFEDEGTLALSITNRTFRGLLMPLDGFQVAPVGFLMLEKLCVYLFGDLDRVYRITPLIISFVMVFEIFKLKPSPHFNKIAFLLLLLLNPFLLRYCIEVKQYIADVLLAVFIIRNIHQKKNIQNFLTIAVLVWFSNAAFILIIPVSAFYLFNHKAASGKYFPSINNEKKDYLLMGICFLSMLVYYLLFVRGNPNKEVMLNFWHRIQGIYEPGSNYLLFIYNCFCKTCEMIKPFYDLFYLTKLSVVYIGLFILFVISTLKSDMGKFFLVLFLTHLLFSSFSLYPFDTRLILYLLPFIVYLVVMKIAALKYANWGFILVYCVVPISLCRKPVFPFRTDNTVNYIKHLNNAGYKNVYCYGGSERIAKFYKKTLQLPIRIIDIEDMHEKLDSTIPILVLGYQIDELPKDFSAGNYSTYDTLTNIFKIQQISETNMLLPKHKM